MLTNDSDSTTRIRIQSTKTIVVDDNDNNDLLCSSPRRKSLSSSSEPSNRSSFISSRFIQATSSNLSPTKKPLVHHASEIAAQNYHHQQQLLNGNNRNNSRSVSFSIIDMQHSLSSSVVPGNLSKQDLNGLNIAGVAVTLLTTIFTFFHPMYIVNMMISSSSSSVSVSNGNKKTSDMNEGETDSIADAFVAEQREEEIVFQQQTHTTRNHPNHTHHHHHSTMQKLIIYCVLIPGLVVALSWMIDVWSHQHGHKRTDLVSVSGCIFAIAFIIPFLVPLFVPDSGYGYMLSTSFFDLAYAFTVIVLGSTFIDCQNMTTKGRIAFMSSSEIMYLLVSLTTCQFGLPHFYNNNDDTNNNSNSSSSSRSRSASIVTLDNNHTDEFNNNNNDNDEEPNYDHSSSSSSGSSSRFSGFDGFIRFLFVMQCLACFLFIVAQRFFATTTTTTSNLLRSVNNNNNNNHNKRYNPYNNTQHINHQHHRDVESNVDGYNNGSVKITTTSHAWSLLLSSSSLSSIRNSIIGILDQQLIQIRYVLWDLWNHKNFCLWIIMEALSKAQSSFVSYFLYLLMSRFVAGQTEYLFYNHHHLASSTTFSNFGTIFLIATSKQIGTILAYIPIGLFGYYQVYRNLAQFSLLLACFVLTTTTIMTQYYNYSELWIVLYMYVHVTLIRSFQSAGMYLVMVDVLTELRHKHVVLEHRSYNNEPTTTVFAAMVLGVNAFFVKPTRIVFAVLAESVSTHIHMKYNNNNNNNNNHHMSTTTNDNDGLMLLFHTDESKRELLYYTVVTVICCSTLQLIVWKHYDLKPNRVLKLREEMKLIQLRDHQQQQQQIVRNNNNNNNNKRSTTTTTTTEFQVLLSQNGLLDY